jgi:hypothetical protein
VTGENTLDFVINNLEPTSNPTGLRVEMMGTASPAFDCSPPSGSFFPVGTTQVTCTTLAGPSCTFTVTVQDTQKPAITCPANITAVAPTPTSPCAVVNFTPTASDNCPGVTVACVPPSGSCFPAGTTTVTCTATDASGNTAACSFTVKVFNTCLQDAQTGDTLRLIYATGEYRYCRKSDGFTLSGFGTVQANQPCYFQMQHQGQTATPPRTLSVQVQKCANYGSAQVQARNLGFTRNLKDNNLRDNACICP